jgi:hypothetical protein
MLWKKDGEEGGMRITKEHCHYKKKKGKVEGWGRGKYCSFV